MKKVLVVIILLLTGSAVGLIAMRGNGGDSAEADDSTAKVMTTQSDEKTTRQSMKVPAYQTTEESRRLGATLDPSQFFGKAREAYQIAKKIPVTLAQLPCYCHCDQSFGHKSLHTCFEDDHASHCAVCVDEALLAYQLETEEKLAPDQVRSRIIENYSTGHGHSH